jgi:hypothetical protein
VPLSGPVFYALRIFSWRFRIQKNIRVQQESRVKVEIDNKKIIFSSISDIGCFSVIRNSIQCLYACKVSSPKDKWGKHENKQDFLNKILRYYVCIFS